MRPHVDALPGQEFGRAHLVEEDERPHHLPRLRGQRAAHLEAAQIARARHDHGLDRIHRVAQRNAGIKQGVPAHARLLCVTRPT